MARNPVSTAKAVSEKKGEPKQKSSAKLAPSLHPPYLQMIKEAISALKERTGSSQPAIAKYIEEKYNAALPPNFKKILSVQLKKFAKSEKLVKVKNSFKIGASEKAKKVASDPKEKKPAKKEEKPKPPTEKVAGEKKQKAAATGGGAKGKVKTKRLSQVSTPKELKKKKKSLTPKKVTKSIKKSPKPKTVAKRARKA